MTSTLDTITTSLKQMRKVVLASFMGTALETYDLYLYGTAAALIFAPLYFSNQEPALALVLSLLTFAVSFIARPIGALVFGHFGDKIGRKRTLYVTLLLMGISTALVGALPTYDMIGVAAPIILVLLRFLQGIGFGGEYSGAVLMILEHAPAEKRGFYAGLNNAGPAVGFLASSGIFLGMSLTMSDDAFLTWGWRIPFLFSLALVAVGLYLRMAIAESPVFEKARAIETKQSKTQIPVVNVFRYYWRELLLASGSFILIFAMFYLVSVHTLSYGVSNLGLSRDVLLIALMLGVAIYGLAIPIFSNLSDRIGRKKILLIGVALAAAWQFPFYWLLDTANIVLIGIAVTVELIIYAAIYGPAAAFVSELFGSKGRYTGSAVSYNIAGILGAAPAPIVATLLVNETGASWPIALYMVAIAAISFFCILALPETRNRDLTADRSAAPVSPGATADGELAKETHR